MERKVQVVLEKIGKEADRLTPEKQLELVGKLIHQLREMELAEKEHLDWGKLYGLGKEVWEREDAQEYVNRLREERG